MDNNQNMGGLRQWLAEVLDPNAFDLVWVHLHGARWNGSFETRRMEALCMADEFIRMVLETASQRKLTTGSGEEANNAI